MRYLLDTNAISEALKTRPNPGFISWLESVSQASDLDDGLYISVLTIAEMRRGALKLESGVRRNVRHFENSGCRLLSPWNEA